jgi:prolipoprotein diacylglyceryltransferase
MILAGAERFLIELIREHGDSLYRMGGMVFSQAQLISILLMAVGGAWFLLLRKQTN